MTLVPGLLSYRRSTPRPVEYGPWMLRTITCPSCHVAAEEHENYTACTRLVQDILLERIAELERTVNLLHASRS